ncbi:MAG: BrnT family toxin, partial [Pseudomonadota bacterium]|nr:BrnT family toxin [Pseudomonadota bacterium]
MIKFEWDEAKASSNLKKHGISFHEAKSVFYDENAVQDDGSCTYDCSIFTEADYESVSITVNGGSYQYEVGW